MIRYPKNVNSQDIEICILAGGKSRRMGRDKAALRLGGRTLLERLTLEAKKVTEEVRVIREDLVPACGPVGGILTALTTTAAERVLFASCDMPFATARLFHHLIARTDTESPAAFLMDHGRAGFPLLVQTRALEEVRRCWKEGIRSMQELARELRAPMLKQPAWANLERMNVNTPEEFAEAEALHKEFQRRKNATK